jgi:transcription elongation factor Elf1
MEEEYFFECPWCGEMVSMNLDLSVPHQTYIEDCEVCCRPIEIEYRNGGGKVEEFNARQG